MLEEELEQEQEQEQQVEVIDEAPVEEKGKKKKIKGLPSTIVSGVFILISLICLAVAFSINLAAIADDFTKNVDNAGEAIGAVFALIVVFAMMILIILASLILPAGFGITSLILSIKNVKKAEKKPLRILGIVFTALSALILLAVIGRLLMLFIGKM